MSAKFKIPLLACLFLSIQASYASMSNAQEEDEYNCDYAPAHPVISNTQKKFEVGTILSPDATLQTVTFQSAKIDADVKTYLCNHVNLEITISFPKNTWTLETYSMVESLLTQIRNSPTAFNGLGPLLAESDLQKFITVNTQTQSVVSAEDTYLKKVGDFYIIHEQGDDRDVLIIEAISAFPY